MNRDKASRYSFGQVIRDNITYNSTDIKIYDSVTTNEIQNENTYILLTNQNAVNDADYTRFRWRCRQTLEIISKQINSVSKDICDDIGEQVETIVLAAFTQPGNGGLAQQTGWEIQDILLEEVNYTDFQLENNFYEITKILTFSFIITKI